MEPTFICQNGATWYAYFFGGVHCAIPNIRTNGEHHKPANDNPVFLFDSHGQRGDEGVSVHAEKQTTGME